jgi:hypothetical protein
MHSLVHRMSHFMLISAYLLGSVLFVLGQHEPRLLRDPAGVHLQVGIPSSDSSWIILFWSM